MQPRDILDWADGIEQTYADEYIATSQILKEHNIYNQMGSYFALSTDSLKQEYAISPDRPLVHIDVGCGTGYALHEMDLALREANNGRANHLLIGIDFNTHMCRHAVKTLLDEGHTVEQHIHQKKKIARKDNRLKLEHEFPIHHAEIADMNLAPDGRIVILQDDIQRQNTVLNEILLELKRRYDIAHVDSMSFAQPGFAGDAASSGKSAAAIELFLASQKERESASGDFVRKITDATLARAQALLGFGGSFISVNRLINGDKLKELYAHITGSQRFPAEEDEQGQLRVRMTMGMATLGKSAHHFRLKMGAILQPDYHVIENQTPIEYSTYSPIQGAIGRPIKGLPDRGHDLFALTVMRQDVHPIGHIATSMRTFSTERPTTDS